MIKDAIRLDQWEKQYLRKSPSDFFHDLRLFEAMYQEARALGVYPLKNPLEGVEVRIRLAEAINVSRAA